MCAIAGQAPSRFLSSGCQFHRKVQAGESVLGIEPCLDEVCTWCVGSVISLKVASLRPIVMWVVVPF